MSIDTRDTPSIRSPQELGAQPERTLLAWLRTCLGLILNGFLLIRISLPHDDVALLSSGLAAIAAGGLLYTRARRRLNVTHGKVASAHSMHLGLTVCVTLLLCLAKAWYDMVH